MAGILNGTRTRYRIPLDIAAFHSKFASKHSNAAAVFICRIIADGGSGFQSKLGAIDIHAAAVAACAAVSTVFFRFIFGNCSAAHRKRCVRAFYINAAAVFGGIAFNFAAGHFKATTLVVHAAAGHCRVADNLCAVFERQGAAFIDIDSAAVVGRLVCISRSRAADCCVVERYRAAV